MSDFYQDLRFYTYVYCSGTPNGCMYGGIDKNESASYVSTLNIRDWTNDFVYTYYHASKLGYIRHYGDEFLKQFETYDPRCRDWYTNAIKYTFSGSFEQAFPVETNDFHAFFINDATDECVETIEEYTELFDIKYDSNSGEYFANKSLTKASDVAWTRYIFNEGSVGLAVSKAMVNETTGQLLGVAAVAYNFDKISTFLNATNDENDWVAWVFETNNSEMVASSDGQVRLYFYVNFLEISNIFLLFFNFFRF